MWIVIRNLAISVFTTANYIIIAHNCRTIYIYMSNENNM